MACALCARSFISYSYMIDFLESYKHNPNRDVNNIIKLNGLLPHSKQKCDSPQCNVNICYNCYNKFKFNSYKCPSCYMKDKVFPHLITK